ncbi:MAG TPA: T9SS type A sorting domain-containing protein [Bacteroidia bacterium]|nr:T9SS type A sorting domain-containing protein [Bacteroidia bacterium]
MLLFLLGASTSAHAQSPYPLEPGFQIDSVMVTHPGPNRMAHDPVSGHLFYCLPGGDVYEISLPSGQPATEVLAFTLADHGIVHPQGMHFRDSVLYLSGNTNAIPGYVTARISKGTLQPNGSRSWTTVVQTQPHPASKHPFTSVVSDPQGQFLYWASGARTMAGEIFEDNGLHPGRREGPYNSRIYKIPIGTVGLTLPGDSASLDSSGYVYCQGLRNAYDMDWDAAGELFSIDNSGERDDPEELNWLRPGRHYGFPWKMGDHWNPLRDPGYDVTQDPLVNPLCGGYLEGIFAADPTFPFPPNVTFEDPIRNTGPNAVYFRDSVTGLVQNAHDIGGSLRSFTAHRSPLGLLIDRDSLLEGAYAGAGLVLSYMPGGDSSGMSPIAPWGTPGPFVDPCQDMLKLDLHWDTGLGEYVMGSRSIIGGFYLPVDAAQVGNVVYVIEQRGGGRSNLWKVTFPPASNASPEAHSPLQYAIHVAPNPSNGNASIHVQVAQADAVNLAIHDLGGRQMLQADDWRLQPGINDLQLDLSELTAGMYLLRIDGRLGNGWVRLVVE